MTLTMFKRAEPGETDPSAQSPVPAAPSPLPVVLPRVNLLPPEILQRRRFHQLQIGLGVAVLGCASLVAMLYVGATGSVADAAGGLSTAQATGQQLQAEQAKYQDMTSVFAQATAAKGLLTTAMGEEIRFSGLLSELSTTLPEDVWLGTVALNQGATPGAAGATGGVGTVTFGGTGFSHDSVAAWLEAVDRSELYSDAYFSKSSEALMANRKTVTFASTATLTPAALSRRYLQGGG
ncbi:MAG: Fimbrial assembly family protein [Frankiales bacterium]|jgi:Tfp pilus assembly protein PilN|nr:Fimbrial assembly family protein [Frankiales bacterium]